MIDESLSALMDGECEAGEIGRVLDALEAAPALKARWSRQCLVREALAGTQVSRPLPDFSAAVMAALSQEPAAAGTGAKVVPLRRAAARPSGLRWRPLAGLAAAASFAAVAVVGTRTMLLSDSSSAKAPTVLASAPAADGSGARGALLPVSTRAVETADGKEETGWSQLDPASAKLLNEYLMEHSNFRAEQGMGGALSYARMAVRTAEYRPDGSR